MSEGGGRGPSGEKPPGAAEQCATAAIDFSTPGHGSGREAVESVQFRAPMHAAAAKAAKPPSLHALAGAYHAGQAPAWLPKSATGSASMTPLTHSSVSEIAPTAALKLQKGFEAFGDAAGGSADAVARGASSKPAATVAATTAATAALGGRAPGRPTLQPRRRIPGEDCAVDASIYFICPSAPHSAPGLDWIAALATPRVETLRVDCAPVRTSPESAIEREQARG